MATKKKRHLKPPLTFLDKTIYFLCIVLSFLLSLLLAFALDDIQNAIAFSEIGTIAYSSNGSTFFALPFLCYFEISALVFFIVAWEEKRPIFGSKKYKYCEYPFKEDCAPLFHRKRYNVRISPSRKKWIRQMTILWCTFLILLAALTPLSLFGRDALYQDNHVAKISTLNVTKDTYSPDDFAHLTIQTQHVVNPKAADYWKYEITIEMKDGQKFTFSNRDFDWRVSGSKDLCLDKMLEIKGLFDADRITVKGSQNKDDVADFLGLNEQQRAKLEKLLS